MAEGIVGGVIMSSILLIGLGLLALAYMGYLDYQHKQYLEGERKRFRELKTFILSLSHDFQAPLARITGLNNLAKMNPQEVPEYLEIQQKVIYDMSSLLGELLEVIKLDDEERPKTEIRFESLIDTILENFKDNPEYAGVKIDRNIKIDRPFFSDQWLVHTILFNLISNAFKYRKKNHYSFIVIEIKRWKGWIIIKIGDNGIGISEKDQETIFDFQKRVTSQEQGLGLGLYIVRTAVEKLGGAIDVISTEGEKTIFKIYVPYQSS